MRSRSQRPKLCGALPGRPTYSSMWKAVTRDQSIPFAATSVSRNSFCDGAAAKMTDTGFVAINSRSLAAAASPAARPSAARST